MAEIVLLAIPRYDATVTAVPHTEPMGSDQIDLTLIILIIVLLLGGGIGIGGC